MIVDRIFLVYYVNSAMVSQVVCIRILLAVYPGESDGEEPTHGVSDEID
jgi:hypothetical protein